jgi:uncharacterized lipoprotein YddW (UPF0748 family)
MTEQISIIRRCRVFVFLVLAVATLLLGFGFCRFVPFSFAEQKNPEVKAGTVRPRFAPVSTAVNGERRVMFDEDIRWAMSPADTDRIIARLKAAGINVYVPCVWHGRGSYYPTRVAHKDERLARSIAAGRDPLAYLLKKAHEAGIEVHPWFTVVRREDTRYPEFFGKGTPSDAYDVHDERFRTFIVTLMLDLVARYEIDGINLDYIRSIGMCEREQCADEYRRKYGRLLAADLLQAKIPGNRVSTLEEWNSVAVSDIVRTFALSAREMRNSLVISVDGHPLSRDLLREGQDSVTWERNGWIDVVYSMDYRKQPDMAVAAKTRKAFANPEALTLLFSIYDLVSPGEVNRLNKKEITGYFGGKAVVSREPELLQNYVQLSRRYLPGGGAAFYHLPRLTEEQAKTLRETVYREPVPPRWPAPGLQLQ